MTVKAEKKPIAKKAISLSLYTTVLIVTMLTSYYQVSSILTLQYVPNLELALCAALTVTIVMIVLKIKSIISDLWLILEYNAKIEELYFIEKEEYVDSHRADFIVSWLIKNSHKIGKL